jgi:guanylate kinase
MSGRLVIVSGPSGVGKDTLLDKWREADPHVCRVVTYTTRAPRAGETDGVDYHFVSRDDFERMASEGAFLEAKEVHGNLYGSPVRETDAAIAEGKVVVLRIDVQGALEVMGRRPDAATVFIFPPSFAELERRIRSRGLDSEEAVRTRLKNARWELDQAGAYQHKVVNDDMDRAVSELARIVADGAVEEAGGTSSAVAEPRMRRYTSLPVALLYALLGLLVLGFLLFPLVSRAGSRAREAKTLLNIRSLGAAVLLYATDNDNRLPPDMSSASAVRRAVARYVADEGAFTTLNPAGGEFLGNRSLSGATLKLGDPGLRSVVMFYDSKAWPDGSRAVVWLDGHAGMVRRVGRDR